MFSVIRRKAAAGGSFASVYGRSLYKLKPEPRACSGILQETLVSSTGCASARTFSHVSHTGLALTSASKKIVVSDILPDDSFKRIWSKSFCSNTEGDLVEAVVPPMGESISDGTLAMFLKKPGDRVEADEAIAQVETDKVTIDVSSPEAGVIQKFTAKEGDTVEPGTKIAIISKSGEGVTHVAPSDEKPSEKGAPPPPPSAEDKKERPPPKTEKAPVEGDLVEAVVPFMGESISDGTLATFLKKPGDRVEVDEAIAQVETDKVTIDVNSPEAGVIQKFIAKEGDTVEPGTKIAIISKSGEGVTHVAPSEKGAPPPSHAEDKRERPPPKTEKTPASEKPKGSPLPPPKPSASEPKLPPKDRERRVPMTRLRKRVATRLKDSQNTFALLTTFNEVDMTNLMKLRSDYKDSFVEKHGVKLGLMSGFVKAAVSALQKQPIVNAVIDGDDIIYRDHIDISIAVGTPKGLVVPVLRGAEGMNFAEVEREINTLAKKATDGTISIDEMAGGTFTISNGGVYGSLLSTPIINPPQSAILGMHSIVNRPMIVGGNIVPRPMMYIALTYDHRLIDGREAVFFLRRIKDVVEDPRRLLLDV